MTKTPNHWAGQFIRFAITGGVAFCVATIIIYATRGFLGTALAGVPAFLSGVTVSWILNKFWTFRYVSERSLFGQWIVYLVMTAPTTIINIIVYEALVYASDRINQSPILASIAAALVGMLASYFIVKFVVFKPGLGP